MKTLAGEIISCTTENDIREIRDPEEGDRVIITVTQGGTLIREWRQKDGNWMTQHFTPSGVVIKTVSKDRLD